MSLVVSRWSSAVSTNVRAMWRGHSCLRTLCASSSRTGGDARAHILRRLFPVFLFVLAAYGQARKPAASAKGFEISGVVTSAVSAEPVPHAKVEIGLSQEQSTLQTVLTGPDGRFTFPNLAAGKYWLSAQAHGFWRQALDEHDGYFTGVAVGRGQNTQNIAFRLHPDASISGNITDTNAEPVAGAQVMLFRATTEEGQSEISLRNQTTTDDQGFYSFVHLSPGKYYVAVSAQPWYAQTPNRELRPYVKVSGEADTAAAPSETPNAALDVAYPVTFYPGVIDPANASAIDLPAGDRDSADISLNAVPAVHLSVARASSDAAQPANGIVEETFGNAVIPVPAQEDTVSSGELEINGLAPGHYLLAIESLGNGGQDRAKSIDVAGDAELDASEASAGVRIQGVVQFEGKPVAEAVVRLRNHESGESFRTQTSQAGEFAFEQASLGPGTYQVSVADVPDSALGSISGSDGRVQGRSVEIAAAGTVQLTIKMTKNLGRVDGVAQRDGKPLGGAMVVLVPQKFETNSSLVRRDQSDSDGTFTLARVLPGKYTVVAIANGWDLEWLNPSVLGPYLKAGTPVEVVPGRKYAVKVRVQ